MVEAALRGRGRPPGQYALQAAIATVRAEAHTAAATDGGRLLLCMSCWPEAPAAVVELNRAVAVAMSAGRPPSRTAAPSRS